MLSVVVSKNIPEAFQKKDISGVFSEAGVIDGEPKVNIIINKHDTGRMCQRTLQLICWTYQSC